MINSVIEQSVERVRQAMSTYMPVDPLRIAQEEGIATAAGTFGESFSGRIEFHPREGKFLLFYPESGNPRRIRFSLAHELGHYYLESHRQKLLVGSAHNSNAGFICDDEMEREADLFAAALLIPRAYIEEKCRSSGFMTLGGIVRMAAECETSITCAAIRYAQYAEEACAVLLSQVGKVLYGITSDEMGASGFRVVRRGIQVPVSSATARCMADQIVGRISEGRSTSAVWFANQFTSIDLWEEAVFLGYAGQVITLLARDKANDEDEE